MRMSGRRAFRKRKNQKPLKQNTAHPVGCFNSKLFRLCNGIARKQQCSSASREAERDTHQETGTDPSFPRPERDKGRPPNCDGIPEGQAPLQCQHPSIPSHRVSLEVILPRARHRRCQCHAGRGFGIPFAVP